jgi:LysR family carnitine catabolism transcriptional activator
MHVQVREGLTSAVHEDVRSGIADFGIGNAIDLAEGVVAESIVQEACYVVMPKRHRLGALSFVSFKDIGDEPMISMPSDSGLRRTLDVAASDRGVIFNHSIIINQFSSLFDFVSRGLGIAIVPASAVPPSNGPSIKVKPLRPPMTRRVGILRLAERSLMPASQAFLEIFQPKFLAATSQRAGRR